MSRTRVNTVFNEKLMGLVSVAILPFFLADLLAPGVEEIVFAAEVVIIAIFLAEYASKLAVAEDKRAFTRQGWEILNLFIILSFFGGLAASLLLAAVAAPSPIIRLLRLVRLGMFVTRASGALEFHKVLLKTRFYHIVGVCGAVIFLGAYGFLAVEPGASSLLAQSLPRTPVGIMLLVTVGVTVLVLAAFTVSRIVESFGASEKVVDALEREVQTLRSEVERLKSSS
ncbi:MAG: ion transporter [Candidatus Bathyarchaeia archaeon]